LLAFHVIAFFGTCKLVILHSVVII